MVVDVVGASDKILIVILILNKDYPQDTHSLFLHFELPIWTSPPSFLNYHYTLSF